MNHRYSNLLLTSLLCVACSPAVDLGDAPGDTDIEESRGAGEPSCEDLCIEGSLQGECDDEGQCLFPDDACASGRRHPLDEGGECSPPEEVAPLDKLDVLFVIDDSSSMGPAQSRLQDSAAGFIAQLEARDVDYRVGITTTDVGNIWCAGVGTSPAERGRLVLKSCREKLDEFSFVGGETIEAAALACSDRCGLETLPVSADKPWIDANELSSESIVDVMQCALPQGIAGCGFESPLEAIRAMLAHSNDAERPEFGFIRPDAHLAVIILTDEMDCSASVSEIFSVDGLRTFWSDPSSVSPRSALCWNAGVDCEELGGGLLECNPSNKAEDGSDAVLETDSVLFPLSRYQLALDNVRATKTQGHGVYLFALAGVPAGYDGVAQIPYRYGPHPDDPLSFQGRFGIGSACDLESGGATPPVRLRDLVNDQPLDDGRLFSVCDESYELTFETIVNEIGE